MPLTHVRSAALTGYAEVARVQMLLEASAHAASVDDFRLRVALSQRLSNLGLIALAAREEPTVRDALACPQRTMHLHNEAIFIDVEEANGIVVVREEILGRMQGPMRQAIELAVAVLYGVLKELLGDSWSPMAVCFVHGPPRDVSTTRGARRHAVSGCPLQRVKLHASILGGNMKLRGLIAALCVAATSAHAADVRVLINVGQPGYYGSIDVVGFPAPQLIYPEPIIVQPVPAGVVVAPVYLYVPAKEAKNWKKHCKKYNACGRPVYFVQDGWYSGVYVPVYKEKKGHGKGGKDKGPKGKD